jgi:hypothetical protein
MAMPIDIGHSYARMRMRCARASGLTPEGMQWQAKVLNASRISDANVATVSMVHTDQPRSPIFQRQPAGKRYPGRQHVLRVQLEVHQTRADSHALL